MHFGNRPLYRRVHRLWPCVLAWALCPRVAHSQDFDTQKMIDEEDRAARTVTLADTAPFDLASTADGAAIRRAMRLRKDPAIACFAIEMMRGTRSAVFTFRFTIDGEGKVVGLQEIDPQDEHRGIADCLWNILRIFHFPTSSPANFSYTFRFASNGKYKAPVRKPPPPPPPEVQRALEEYLRGLQGK